MSNVRELRNRLVRQPDSETLSQRNDGGWEATCTYKTWWETVFRVMPRRNRHRHPDFNFMVADSVSVTKESPGVAVITVKYIGIPTTEDGSGSNDPQDEPVVSIQNGTSQEPIESHPDFVSTIAGTSGAPLNGATFDDGGKWTGFAADSAFAGVDSYLVPSITFRRSYVSRNKPTSLAAVGKRDTPSDAPTAGGSRGWLKTSLNYERRGDLYQITEEWLLSGPDGWNTTIYESA